jgi:hypothetical protein
MNIYSALFLAAGVFCGNVAVYGLNKQGISVGSLAAAITFVGMLAFEFIKSR